MTALTISKRELKAVRYACILTETEILQEVDKGANVLLMLNITQDPIENTLYDIGYISRDFTNKAINK